MNRTSHIGKQSLRSSGYWRYQLLVIFLFSMQFVGVAYALEPPVAAVSGRVALRDGKLTARLSAMPLRQVMEEVSRVSGARVQWLGGVAEERAVSVGFTALPLAEALRQILGESNFLLFYAPGGADTRLTEIWISSKKTGDGHSGLTSRLAGQAPPLLAFDAHSENAEEGQAELDPAAIETLIQTAVGTQSPAVRVEAIARLGEYLREEPKVGDVLSHLASHESDPHVQAAASEVLAGIASMEE